MKEVRVCSVCKELEQVRGLRPIFNQLIGVYAVTCTGPTKFTKLVVLL